MLGVKPMSNKQKKNKKSTSIHWPTVLLITTLVILLIPTTAIGLVLLDTFESTGTSMHGNRFATERQNELTEQQLSSIESQVSQLSDVDNATVNLKSGTVRVNVQLNDALNIEQAKEVVENILDTIFSIADKDTYFTMSGMFKQYDLEVHAINSFAVDSDEFIYYLANKNSVMEDVNIQLVSDPINPAFVNDLYENLYGVDDEEEGNE